MRYGLDSYGQYYTVWAGVTAARDTVVAIPGAMVMIGEEVKLMSTRASSATPWASPTRNPNADPSR